jgi:hypothetical protein
MQQSNPSPSNLVMCIISEGLRDGITLTPEEYEVCHAKVASKEKKNEEINLTL